MKTYPIVSVILLSLSFAMNRAPGAVIISDGTFDNDDYSVIVSSAQPGAPSGTGTFAQITNGGNPGDYQEDYFETGAASSTNPVDPYSARGAVFNEVDSYNPATQGAITSLDFSADLKTDSFGDPSYYIVFFAEQNGILFRSPTFLTTDADQLSDDWTPYSDTEDLSSAFLTPNPKAVTDPLNFSSTGAPIYFGIGVSFLINAPNQYDGFDIDNFMVDVNDLPEPSTWAMVPCGLVLFALWQMRRQRC